MKSVLAHTHIVELKDGKISEYLIRPEDAGLSLSNLSEVMGGSPIENANIIDGIFSGEITGAKLNIVLLNSAAGLIVAGKVSNFKEGVELARHAIKSGKTLNLLNKLRRRA